MAGPWEKYAQPAATPGPWQKYAQPATPAPEEAAVESNNLPPVTATDRVSAAGAGFNAGLAGIAGMPMDAATNLVNLGKASIGSLRSLFTNSDVPESLRIKEGVVPGGSEWFRGLMDRNGFTSTQVARPDDPVSRYTAAATSGVPGLAMGKAPTSVPAMLSAVNQGATAGVVGQAVADAGGSPALQMEASMLAPGVSALRSAVPMPSKKPPAPVAKTDMSPDQLHAADVDVLSQNGVRTFTGQRGTGATASAAKSAGRGAEAVLGTSKQRFEQALDFTSALLRHAGFEGRRATPDAMAKMKSEVNQAYEKMHDDTPLALTPKARQTLEDTYNEAAAELGPNSNEAAALRKQIDNLYEKSANDSVPGEASQVTRSSLLRLGQSQNGSLAFHSRAIRKVLDDALEEGAPSDSARSHIKETRERYHRFKQIEDMVSGRTDGVITPARANLILSKRANRGEYIFGRGDQEMADLVRAGNNVLKDLPDSGTTPRSMDIAKIATAIHDPIMAMKIGGTLLGGRLVNEWNPTSKTPQGRQNYVEKQAKLQNKALVGGAAGATANAARETEEERRRRELAKTLRK